MLEEELVKRGFSVEGGIATRTDEQGVTIRIDIDKRKVHVGKREEKDVEVTLTRSIASNQKEADEGMRDRVRAEAADAIDGQKERERRTFTEQIEKKLGDVRGELDEIVVAVTQQALRRRAAQIGEIQSVEQDESTGSMTIRVRV